MYYLKSRILHYIALYLLIVFFCYAIAPYFTLQDFLMYLRASSDWIHGNNPYQLPLPSSYIQECLFGEVDSSKNLLQVWSPPFVFPIFGVISFLSIHLQKTLYLILILYCLYSIKLFIQNIPHVHVTWGVKGFAIIPASILFLISAYPLGMWEWVILYGGVSIISLAFFYTGIYCIRKNLLLLGGILMSPLIIKPHIGCPLLLACVMYFWVRKIFPAIRGIIYGILFQLLISFLMNNRAWSDYSQLDMTLPLEYVKFTGGLPASLIWHELLFPAQGVFLGLVCTCILVISSIIYQLYYSKGKETLCLEEYLAWIIPSIFLCNPYIWPHDQTIMGISFFYTLTEIIKYSKIKIRLYVLIAVWVSAICGYLLTFLTYYPDRILISMMMLTLLTLYTKILKDSA
jgi:hypothetical protein